MPGDPAQRIKAAQAANFDDFNHLVAGTPYDRHLRFLNFGYRTLAHEPHRGPRLGPAFPNRDSAQLLFQLVGDLDLTGARVLEVGCGRGGNLWLLRRHAELAAVLGVDIVESSVRHCTATITGEDGCFIVGDAEAVGLADACVDVLLNIESAATYPRPERFFREAARLVRPGGHLLYADIVNAELVEPYRRVLDRLGFEEVEHRDITPNVLAARAARSERERLTLASAGADPAADEFAGTDDSVLTTELSSGRVIYLLHRARRRPTATTAEPLLAEEETATAFRHAELAARHLTFTDRPPAHAS